MNTVYLFDPLITERTFIMTVYACKYNDQTLRIVQGASKEEASEAYTQMTGNVPDYIQELQPNTEDE